MWLLFRRFVMFSVASWALGKVVVRYPRLAVLQRLLGTVRAAQPYRRR